MLQVFMKALTVAVNIVALMFVNFTGDWSLDQKACFAGKQLK